MEDINFWTLGINTLISLILSIIVLAISIKAGKQRTDRPELMKKYKNLYRIFNRMEDKVEKEISIQDDIDELWKLREQGEHFGLNKDIYEEISMVDKEYLSYLKKVEKWAKKIIEIAKNDLENEVADQELPITQLRTGKHLKFIIEKHLDIKNQSLSFFISSLPEESEKQSIKIKLYYNELESPHYEIKTQIDSEFLDSKTMNEFLKQVFDKAESYSPSIKKQKNEVINRIKTLSQKSEKRGNEPHSIWRTISNAITGSGKY